MKCDVAIVGAGMAGLGAALQLIQNGIDDILLLEASDKAGGRIITLKVDKGVIDLGAQWMHGVDTDLHKLAVEHNLIDPETSDEGLGVYVRDDGYIFDENLVKRVDFQVGVILSECENFVDAECYPSSVGDFLEEKFNEWVDNSDCTDDEKLKVMELFDWHVRFQLIDNCCRDLKQLSARDWGKYSCLGKDGQAHINLKGGYQALVDVLVGILPETIFKYNTIVNTISYLDKKKQLKLVLENGTSVMANHVILTPSIGVLKERMKLFDFSVPNEISNVVSNMGFGGMGKVFLLFDRKWWRSDGFQLIWRRNNARPPEQAGNWTRHLSGFDLVLNQPNMLLGWVSELGAEEMEKLPPETVGHHCVNLLKQFLCRDDIPYPSRVYKSNWSSNKWIRGGYSHTTPACDRSGAGPEALAKPVCIGGVPRVLLAGEAAHASHFSTTHGAYESGKQQASFLVRHLREN